jgi:hypothetical protein
MVPQIHWPAVMGRGHHHHGGRGICNMQNLVQGVEQARAALDDDVTELDRAGPTVPTAAELHLLAKHGYLGECAQWFAVTYGPDAALGWMGDMLAWDIAVGRSNPDLAAMREECEQTKATLDRWRQERAAAGAR